MVEIPSRGVGSGLRGALALLVFPPELSSLRGLRSSVWVGLHSCFVSLVISVFCYSVTSVRCAACVGIDGMRLVDGVQTRVLQVQPVWGVGKGKRSGRDPGVW